MMKQKENGYFVLNKTFDLNSSVHVFFYCAKITVILRTL